jgi:predicted phage terminase large subunit-like protein
MCLQCSKTYEKPADISIDQWSASKFCSTECRGAFKGTEAGREQARIAKNTSQAAHEPAAPPPSAFDTPEMAPLAKELASRVLARRSLLHFTKKTHPSYRAGWVHADICARLERFSRQVQEEKSPRLMLLMPPRHGKSELASIRFPGWHLGQAPHHEIINVGYNLELPMKFSRKVREIVRDPLYRAIFPNTMLDPDVSAAEAWNTTMGGGFQAAGVGGGITGKGAHILIVDDPIKNMQEADSALTRDTLWDWYLSTAYTRLAPGGGVLVIETWWNDDDLAGRLQQAMRDDPKTDQFEIVKYPALAEAYEFRNRETLEIVRLTPQVGTDPTLVPDMPEDDFELLRKPGDALHPARYDEEALRRIKSVQAPRIWSALYQQNPIPDEGLYFRKEYFRTAPNIPEPYGMSIYTAWDFAIGEKQQNDWTVGATILQDYDDNLYVLDVVRFKADSFTIIETVLDVAQRWTIPGSTYQIGFEDGQIWKSIKPLLEKRMQERKLFPACEILKPLTDKLARARSLQGRMQQGRVYFPDTASWRQTTEHELLRFPGGVHDDIVDALAWATNLVVGKSAPRKSESKPLKSWKDKLGDLFVLEGTHMSA